MKSVITLRGSIAKSFDDISQPKVRQSLCRYGIDPGSISPIVKADNDGITQKYIGALLISPINTIMDYSYPLVRRVPNAENAVFVKCRVGFVASEYYLLWRDGDELSVARLNYLNRGQGIKRIFYATEEPVKAVSLEGGRLVINGANQTKRTIDYDI